MDGGDGGNAELSELLKGVLAEANEVYEFVTLGGGKGVEVGAGDENVRFGGGDEEAFELRLDRDGVEMVVELVKGFTIEDIRAGVRAVEGEDAKGFFEMESDHFKDRRVEDVRLGRVASAE